MCSSKPQLASANSTGRRLDNDKDASVIMKTSSDGGKTWGSLQTLSPQGQTHYANGAGLYDRMNKRLVVQYVFIPGGSTKPVKNATYFQITSSDDGRTWSNPRDITRLLAACNPGGTGNMQVQSAGSKVQTPTGRLVWAGHDHAGHVCVWFSDDGGETYSTAPIVRGNEVSIAVADFTGNNQMLYMNGRPQDGMSGHRAQYYSRDNGQSWEGPTQSPLMGDEGGGCEGSVLSVHGVLYFLEPAGKKRVAMVAHCSRDQGKTWPSSTGLNGGARGGYSGMVGRADGMIVAVWEDGSHPLGGLHGAPPDKDSGNFYAQVLNTSWCGL